MPVTITAAGIKYKDPTSGNYIGINAAGSSGLTEIEETLDSLETQINGGESIDVLPPLSTYADGTSGGITYSRNTTTDIVTASGTRSGTSFRDIVFSENAMPTGIVAGGTYTAVFSATSEYLAFTIIFYVNGSPDSMIRLYNSTANKTFQIPVTTTGVEVRIETITGWPANGTATITFPKMTTASTGGGLVEEVEDVSDRVEKVASLFNIFGKPIYHHLFVENYDSYIPSESLYDIRLAHALGFDMIEANTHLCSDGVYVVRHGDGGALGDGLKSVNGTDYSETLFSSVTSTWLRENIMYNASADKFCGPLPTLEEFCQECRKLSMKVKVSTIGAAMVARKYLPDEMIWASGGERTRGFRGVVERVWDYSNETVDQCIAACKEIGAPVNIVLGGTASSHSDERISSIVNAAHTNGFTVGMVYPNSKDIVRVLALGVDCIGSTNYNINVFTNGTAKHITELNDSSLTLGTGATYNSSDDMIEMANGSTVTCAADVRSGMCSLVLRFSGKLSINVGVSSNMTNLNNYESDGEEYVYLANYLPVTGTNWTNWFSITAGATTEIYELTCDCSKA